MLLNPVNGIGFNGIFFASMTVMTRFGCVECDELADGTLRNNSMIGESLMPNTLGADHLFQPFDLAAAPQTRASYLTAIQLAASGSCPRTTVESALCWFVDIARLDVPIQGADGQMTFAIGLDEGMLELVEAHCDGATFVSAMGARCLRARRPRTLYLTPEAGKGLLSDGHLRRWATTNGVDVLLAPSRQVHRSAVGDLSRRAGVRLPATR